MADQDKDDHASEVEDEETSNSDEEPEDQTEDAASESEVDTDTDGEQDAESDVDVDVENESSTAPSDDETSESSEDTSDVSAEDDADDPSDEEGISGFETANASTSDDAFDDLDSDSTDPVNEDGNIGGVFDPESVHESGDDPDVNLQDPYLHKEDVDYQEGGGNTAVYIMGTLLVAVVGGFMYFLVTQTEQGKRIKALLQGNLKEYERAKAREAKEKWEKEQLSQLPKYGTLTLQTSNKQYKYADIKLDGERQYGKLSHSVTEDSFHKYEQRKKEDSDSDADSKDEAESAESETSEGQRDRVTEWRAVRLKLPTTQFQNLNVEDKHNVQVRAPNYKSKSWDLTEEQWSEIEDSPINYKKKLNVNMVPKSGERQIELQQRLKKDEENDYFGEVTIDTIPSGARIMFDNDPLLDEDGEEMTTPVTFDKYYVRNEETDELEEKKIRVDTKVDVGHKIQVRIPDEQGDYPNFVTSLKRQMWTCEWKEESKIEELPDDAPYPKRCNYKFEREVDFKALKGYIEEQKKEKKEVKERNEELRKKLEQRRKKMMKQ